MSEGIPDDDDKNIKININLKENNKDDSSKKKSVDYANTIAFVENLLKEVV
jgi:hypothetical protein